jgi:hypothetical protein
VQSTCWPVDASSWSSCSVPTSSVRISGVSTPQMSASSAPCKRRPRELTRRSGAVAVTGGGIEPKLAPSSCITAAAAPRMVTSTLSSSTGLGIAQASSRRTGSSCVGAAEGSRLSVATTARYCHKLGSTPCTML